MASDPLIDVAWELYDLPPARFTAERNARAKAVKGEDPALAKRIAELRRPSAPAWIIGQLVRHRAERLTQVLELGAELREAQEDLDAATLAQLTKDRRALTAALAREGADLAARQDVNAPSSVLDEVSQTLQAAMADAAAAEAVTSGRLIRSLEAVGFDPVDLADAVAGPAPDGSVTPQRAKAAPDELAARRARREAERAVRDAEAAHQRAERDLAAARRTTADARQREDELTSRREQLRAELRRLDDDLRDAGTATEQATAREQEAEAAKATTGAALERARSALEP
jgi:chromosome segregation ATPase